MTISRRPEAVDDEPFLRQLIHSTVAAGLGAATWPEPVRAQILEIQYASLRASVAEYARVASEVILVDGVQAGWLVTAESPSQVRLVEIMLASEFRSKGIGSSVIRQLLAAARTAGKSVRLCVRVSNSRALALYERLGFQRVAGNEAKQEMVYTAAPAAHSELHTNAEPCSGGKSLM